jgi:hypothetical protein
LEVGKTRVRLWLVLGILTRRVGPKKSWKLDEQNDELLSR